jgi:streptogrisin C
MKRKRPLALFCGLLFGAHSVAFAAQEMPFQYDKNTLAQVEALYGIDENAAIIRLAKEYDAAVQARYIEGRDLPGYAGAWFDSDTQGLVVATSQSEDFRTIERAGAMPALVSHSLAELNAARTQVLDALESGIGPGTARESSIDVRTNAITFGIVDSAFSQASALIEGLHLDVPVRLASVEANDSGFSSNLLGADRTRNSSWPLVGGQYSPCSVGASAEKVVGTTYTAGFATAGHCGSPTNAFVADDGTTSLGTVMQSTYDYTTGTVTNNEDGAWVKTVSPWVPKPQVDGYSDGTINVSATWAGMLGAPVGTTVCRYGSTSGGPYCGQVNALNATYSPTGSITLYGMIKVHGTCTEDGDSGGPLVMPTGQIQGTDTGSPNTHSCSVPHGAFNVYFQPIATTLNRAKSSTTGHPDFAMLTSHGRSAPTISNYLCPDSANSDPGLGIYACDFTSFDSQGGVGISWTASTGDSATVEQIFFRCHPSDPPVNLTLAVSNPYGTTTKYTTFPCP